MSTVNLYSFNSADGLPPAIIAKLNHNFRNIVENMADPAVALSSGSEPPVPRTNEALFYNTANGDLYIWDKVSEFDVNTSGDPYWGWALVDAGFAHAEAGPPTQDFARHNEFIWHDTSQDMIYLYYKPPGTMGSGSWRSLPSIIEGTLVDWLGDSRNVDLLKSILGLS